MTLAQQRAESRRRHSQFRLVLRALPVALVVLVLRFVLHNAFNVQGIVTFADAGSVITGATIIVGLMLAGVISDYKESEKLPAVVGGALTSLDSLSAAGLAVKDLDAGWVRPRVARVANAVDSWLHDGIDDPAMWTVQADVAQLVVDVERAGAPSHYVGRLLASSADLSSALARIQVIRRTEFIRAGYVLMQLLVLIVLLLLVIIDFTSPVMTWVVPGVLALAYTYLILLVHDVDDPFSGAACVDLTPVDTAVATLASPTPTSPTPAASPR
jgi:hypothetical protein